MDTHTLTLGMEFLDLSDANDDEKREAMAIIESSPPNGVEFPFEFKPSLAAVESESSDLCSRTPSPIAANTSTSRSSQCSTPTAGRESRHSQTNTPPLNFATHSQESMQTSVGQQWEITNGGQVVCGPPSGPPQYLYQPSHYFTTNGPIPTHYYLPNNGTLNSTKDVSKMRPTGPRVVNSNGKHIKSDIRTPFFPPVTQYSEGPPIIDGCRAPPSTIANIVSDGMVLNGPPVPPMFSPAFAPPFLPPPTATFTAPQMYLITTPGGSYLTYGISPTIPIPQPSSPHSVPNVNNGEESLKLSEVPSQDNESINLLASDGQSVVDDHSSFDPNTIGSSEYEKDNQIFRQNSDLNTDSNDDELNKSVTEMTFPIDSQLNQSMSDNKSVIDSTLPLNSSENSSLPTTSTNISPQSSSTSSLNTAATNNVWSAAGVQRSWADLFKGSSDIHHNSLMTSSLSSNTSILSNSSIITNNYNITSSENDMGLSGADKCESDAQISSIPMRDDPFARMLAIKLNSICLKHSLPYLIPCGFVNRGNWCYINSTLQALLACPPFYNLMREIGETAGIFRDKSSTPIIDSFAKFFAYFLPSEHLTKKQKSNTNMQSEDLPRGDPFEPRCIYDVLGSIKSECLKGRQEDAEEFLSSVLNGLHDEMIGLLKLSNDDHDKSAVNGDHCTANGYIERDENGIAFPDNDVKRNGQQNDANDYGYDYDIDDDDDANLWKEVGPRHKAMPTRTAKVTSTPILKIFGGSTLSVRTAGKDICGNRQPFLALQLDIQSDKVKSVEDALKYLTTSESIQGYMCPKTKQAMDASAQTFLDTLPPVLILHLKLFVYDVDGGCRKLMKRIEYPVDLELPRECLHYQRWDKEKNVHLKRYKLLSVVYHDGAEAVKGHYITDVYHIGSNQWIRCDDGSIKVIPMQKVLNTDTSRTPYLLFYRRHDTLYATKSAFSSIKGQTFSH